MRTTMTAAAPYRDRAAWLEARRNGIGGSDIAALFGVHPFKTALDVYREKVGEVREQPPTPAMLRGIYLEDVAVKLYTERTGRRVRRQPLRAHPEYPHLIASVDRQVLASDAVATGVLEVKCPGLKTFWRIKRQGLLDYMILQGQHEALVTGSPYTSFAVFSAEQFDLLTFDIFADPDIQARIIEVATEFWRDHVLAGVPPEAPAVAESPEFPEAAETLVVRDDREWAEAVADLREARAIREEAEALERAAKEKLIALAGGYGVFEGGGARIYYRQMPGRKTFKKELLAKDHPEIDLSKYEVEGKPYAEFRPYFLKSETED